MQSNERKLSDECSQVDERRWKAWVAKNRELDRRGAAKRRQFFVLLAVVVAATALLRYLG
jgi:hypothetical protein